MKKVIFIGNIGSGKTTLSQAILGDELEYKKTQSVEVLGNGILDTPGEYLELNHYRGALMITSADAEVIAFVQSAIDKQKMFPPGYGGSFAKTVIGVVTKTDVASEQEIADAEHFLKMAGAKKIFKVSSYDGTGIKEVADFLKDE